MKKLMFFIIILTVFLSLTAVAEAPVVKENKKDFVFHDLVYRGEKLQPIYEIPKNKIIFLEK